VLFHYPGLPEIEFIDREDLPFMAEFEARTPQIQAELAGVLTTTRTSSRPTSTTANVRSTSGRS